ncbi:hypothetical protein ZWY2020_025015 [Hordeum vulgare]|nr:hypothetical protein ZWY2020_025015 [Hordeum vulgare]
MRRTTRPQQPLFLLPHLSLRANQSEYNSPYAHAHIGRSNPTVQKAPPSAAHVEEGARAAERRRISTTICNLLE